MPRSRAQRAATRGAAADARAAAARAAAAATHAARTAAAAQAANQGQNPNAPAPNPNANAPAPPAGGAAVPNPIPPPGGDGHQDAIPLVNAVPVFALSPALVTNGILDYSTPRGVKLYTAATEKLQDNLFDADSAGIHTFLNALADRSMQFGWSYILDIPKDIVFPDEDLVNLLTNHGEISLEQVREHCLTYIDHESRAAQDSRQLYVCLTNSLSKKGRDRLRVWKSDYMIHDEPSGPLFLKVLIRESHIDTRATVRHLRAKIASMGKHFANIKYDVTEFNRHVRNLMDQLASRGEQSEDLLANLFEAYRSAPDKRFIQYIEMKINAYDEGENIQPLDLMQLAQNKYKVLVDEKKWAAPSKEEEKIVALEAQLAKYKPQKSTNNQRPHKTHHNNHNNNSNSKRTNNNSTNNNGTYQKPRWMTRPPSTNERNKPKTVNDIEYWWCPHHKSWGQHKPSECRNKNQHNNGNTNTNRNNRNNSTRSNHSNTTNNNNNSSTNNNNNNNSGNRQLRLATAMEAIAAESTEFITASSLDSPGEDFSQMFDTDSVLIGIDNRCTACISPVLSDFIHPPEPVSTTLIGFGGKPTTGLRKGTLKWSWEDDTGKNHVHIIPDSYYVPQATIRLLSPQHWIQTLNTTGICQTYADHTKLQWDCYTKTTHMDHKGVFTFTMSPGFDNFIAYMAIASDDPYADDTNPICIECQTTHLTDDLPMDNEPIHTFTFDLPTQEELQEEQHQLLLPTPLEAELLNYHYKYGHLSFARLRELAKQGILPKQLATCATPACLSCIYGTQTKKPWRSKPHQDYNLPKPSIPGECVSVDILTSPTPGFIAQLTGSLTSRRYHHAAVYVDQATGYGFIHLQKSVSEEETLVGKQAFENHCKRYNIEIQAYHADNDIFAANAWKQSCLEKGQPLTFAGVGAHHQNGIAERRIRLLQDMARTMLIHAHSRWPEAITTHLWPYAVRMANDVLNSTPNMKHPNKGIPEAIFTNTNTVVSNPKHWHHFGSPAYVLAKPLQTDVNIYHKWKQRSRLGIYLGRSPQHAREVALVLNLETGLVSPQFHVKIDSTFKTLQDIGDLHPQILWKTKSGLFHAPRDTHNTTTSDPEGETPRITTPRPTEVPIQSSEGVESTIPTETTTNQTTTYEVPTTIQEEPPNSLPPLRRSTRISTPPDRLTYSWTAEIESEIPGEIFSSSALFLQDEILAFAASNDPDTLYYHQAMASPDKKEFIKAMEEEINGQIKNEIFTIIPRKEVPQDKRVLPTVWAMRRKRRIATGQVYKWKARLNIDGSKQIKGEDYWETYAPVANWASIRLLLTHAIINKWHTRQIDYVQAYTQAEVETEMYMEIPKGYKIDDPSDDFVLKLNKNIYGQKQAGLVWNKHLVQRLEKVGLKQCETDPCIFTKGKIVYILYTDDSILMGPDPKELDNLIDKMKATKLELTVEGDISDFLGVKIDYKRDGTIHLTQPLLINSILHELQLDKPNTKIKTTPAASTKILSALPDSEPFDGHFHYRRIIGKLNYLEKSTRPDISYAVHQCARFSSDPKQEHGEAIKWLCRYLAGTKDKGLILRPDKTASFQVFVDADFAGNWVPEEAQDDINTARSRYGYIVTYHGCPVTWASKMQTEVALSSTESEFIALSHTLRSTIPLMELLKELQSKNIGFPQTKPGIHCKVFEDNSGAIELAKVPKMRPRTKHINVKYHHFREYIEREDISIHYIPTDDQPADMMTKPLNETLINKHRFTIMGWKGK
jgi:hypothetical protein